MLLAAGLSAGAAVAESGRAETTVTLLPFADLKDWAEDDHAAAFRTFRKTCAKMVGDDWRAICSNAAVDPASDPRGFFERLFHPVLIEDGSPALFTGYYEPELEGAREPGGRFRHPLYALPPEATGTRPWFTRRELLEGGKLEGRGLEIAWLDDPVDLFFLQVQGSGRIRLEDGKVIRVGYAGRNGQPYRSIGAELVRRGIYTAQELSADILKAWLRRHPDEGRELMLGNPSYVFFREINEVPPEDGPLGAMNHSVTPMRSIAVDPSFVPLGAPVWIEMAGEIRMRRLMVAQDTGSAIKGAQRADVFFGTGTVAGTEAGQLRDPGRMIVLMPIARARAMQSGQVP